MAQAPQNHKKVKVVGPHSRCLQRGVLGEHVDGRTRAGRALLRIQGELRAAIGRPPTFSDELLIRRVARLTLQLELFDQKLHEGQQFNEYDGRVFNALGNQIRLALRDLKIPPAAVENAPPSLATIAARHKAAMQ